MNRPIGLIKRVSLFELNKQIDRSIKMVRPVGLNNFWTDRNGPVRSNGSTDRFLTATKNLVFGAKNWMNGSEALRTSSMYSWCALGLYSSLLGACVAQFLPVTLCKVEFVYIGKVLWWRCSGTRAFMFGNIVKFLELGCFFDARLYFHPLCFLEWTASFGWTAVSSEFLRNMPERH